LQRFRESFSVRMAHISTAPISSSKGLNGVCPQGPNERADVETQCFPTNRQLRLQHNARHLRKVHCFTSKKFNNTLKRTKEPKQKFLSDCHFARLSWFPRF